jgi:hypothetical protein
MVTKFDGLWLCRQLRWDEKAGTNPNAERLRISIKWAYERRRSALGSAVAFSAEGCASGSEAKTV